MKVTAEIISIGDEILIGQIVNTNSVWLSQELNNIGVWVSKITTIGDSKEQIVSSLKDALFTNDIVIITGGLGPTNDDLTKLSLQNYFNIGLKKEDSVEKNIKEIFAKANVEFLPAHEQQAYILQNSELLLNNYGTAPGMWIELSTKTVIVLPGVPSEMKGIMNDFVFDKLKNKYQLPAILHKTIITFGIAESSLSAMLSEVENSLPQNIKLAYLPDYGKVRLRLTGVFKYSDTSIIDELFEKIKNLIPSQNIASIVDLKHEEIIAKILKQKKLTLAVAESCTGGYISHLITSVSGSSEYFMGSVTAYDNSIKKNILEVKSETIEQFGAVSEQCVVQMAEGVRKKFDSDFSISTSGIAGPTGATNEKPIGMVWIAVSSKIKTTTRLLQLRGTRLNIIQNASNVALEMLRRVISEDNE